MADHWSPTFAPSKFSLSGDQLTATATDHNHTDTIIGVVSQTSGKGYFEIAAASSGADLGWGLAPSTASLGVLLGSSGNGVGFRNNRNWRLGGAETASGMPSPPNNETLGFAVDLTNSRIWVCKTSAPTTWYGNNGTGDPVAGTNGFSISSLAGVALFLGFTSNQNGIDEAATMNVGGSAFAGTVPSGYTAWQDLGAAPSPANASLSATIADLTAAITAGGIQDHWSTTFAPTKFSLSADKLTATATDHNHTDTIIGVVSQTTDKVYVEFTIPGTANDVFVGLANGSHANNSVISSSNDSLSIRFYGSGAHQWGFNNVGTNSGLSGALAAGTIIGIAIDLTSKLCWVRNTAAPSSWYGNKGAGDPVAGTNGYPYAGFATAAVFLAWTSNQNGVDVAVTMNAGGSAFAAPAPSGYSAWQATAAVAPANASLGKILADLTAAITATASIGASVAKTVAAPAPAISARVIASASLAEPIAEPVPVITTKAIASARAAAALAPFTEAITVAKGYTATLEAEIDKIPPSISAGVAVAARLAQTMAAPVGRATVTTGGTPPPTRHASEAVTIITG